MIDLFDIINQAIKAGHDVTLEQDGVKVRISPRGGEKEKPKSTAGPCPEEKEQKSETKVRRNEPEVRQKKKRPPLDNGKIKALRDAGWTLKQIAEEMGVTDMTISNRLKEMYKNDEKNTDTISKDL